MKLMLGNSRTVHKSIEFLTLGLLSSLWNIYHSTTAHFFDPPCILVTIHRILCFARRCGLITTSGHSNLATDRIAAVARVRVHCSTKAPVAAVRSLSTNDRSLRCKLSAESVFYITRQSLSPLKCLFSWGSRLPWQMVPWAHTTLPPVGSRLVRPLLQGTTHTHRPHTDHVTSNICSNRPHLCTTVRPGDED